MEAIGSVVIGQAARLSAALRAVAISVAERWWRRVRHHGVHGALPRAAVRRLSASKFSFN